MFSPRADRALRRLVAELASASAEDIAAVVAQLDPRQRQKVEELLAAHQGISGLAPLPDRKPQPTDGLTAGLSPWLASRLAEAGPGGFGAGSGMTATAAAALKEVARALKQNAAGPAAKLRSSRVPGAGDWLQENFLAKRGQP